MGYLVGTECKATLTQAAQQACAELHGVSTAGLVQCIGVTPIAGGQALQVRTTPASGPATTALVEMPQLGCNESEKVQDLAELFGLGLVAVLGVFLLREFVVRHVMPQ